MVLNQTLAKRGVTNTGQDDFVLDNAFALIEGFWEAWGEVPGVWSAIQNQCRRQIGNGW